MDELILEWIKRVKERHELVKGNEQATKQSLIAPLFQMLGYDLTDPRECIPEYKADFGKDRSKTPVDWAFLQDGKPIFFVEAKEVGKQLTGFDEQLASYFNMSEAKLGILTNGLRWRFFTDLTKPNQMDYEPFATWDVLQDETPPISLLTLIQKRDYKSHLIRAFAEQRRTRTLLLGELTKLLEPSKEFIKLAIANLETRILKEAVLESWRPIIANALHDWVNQQAVMIALKQNKDAAKDNPRKEGTNPSANRTAGGNGNGKENATGSTSTSTSAARTEIVTTEEELRIFRAIQTLLGGDRPCEYEDTMSYLKMHLPEKKTWVFCRLYADRRRPMVAVPLPIEKVQPLLPSFETSTQQLGWTNVILVGEEDIPPLREVLRLAWDQVKSIRTKSQDPEDADVGSAPGVGVGAGSVAAGKSGNGEGGQGGDSFLMRGPTGPDAGS